MAEIQTGSSTKSQTTSTSNGDQAALALKSTVVDGAHELTSEIKHLAGDVADQAKKTAESSLAGGQKRAAESLGSVANAIRKTGAHLRETDQGQLTEYMDRAASQIDVASDYLQTRTIGQVVGDVERFARREPALFLGGAFVAGLVGGRFLKSSRPAAPQGQNGQSRSQASHGGGQPGRGSDRSNRTHPERSGGAADGQGRDSIRDQGYRPNRPAGGSFEAAAQGSSARPGNDSSTLKPSSPPASSTSQAKPKSATDILAKPTGAK